MPQINNNEIPENDHHIRRNTFNAINNINRRACQNNQPPNAERNTNLDIPAALARQQHQIAYELHGDNIFTIIKNFTPREYKYFLTKFMMIIFGIIILCLLFAGCCWLVQNQKEWAHVLVAGITMAVIIKYASN